MGAFSNMRKWMILLLTVLCLSLPVSAQAVFRGEADFGCMDFKPAKDGYTVYTELKNDAAYPIGIYVQTEGETGGMLRLSVRQSGKTALVFEGNAAALAECRALLCRLEAQGTAVVQGRLESEEVSPASLKLTAEPLEEPGSADHAKLVFYVCIWMALVLLSSYLAIVLANKFGKKK